MMIAHHQLRSSSEFLSFIDLFVCDLVSCCFSGEVRQVQGPGSWVLKMGPGSLKRVLGAESCVLMGA